MVIKHPIQIDMRTNGPTPVVDAVQGDSNTREVVVSLFENSVPWSPTDYNNIVVAVEKPDGKHCVYDKLPNGDVAASVDGNIISAKLADEALSAPGVASAAVILVDSDLNQIATFPFKINIASNPNGTNPVSNNYYYYSNLDSINRAIGDISNLKTTVKTSIVGAINDVLEFIGRLEEQDDEQYGELNNLIASVRRLVLSLSSTVGDPSDLDTNEKTILVYAVNEVLAEVGVIAEIIGQLSSLNTNNKNDVVSAVNEVKEQAESANEKTNSRITQEVDSINGKIGDLNNLTSEAKDSIVSAINSALRSLTIVSNKIGSLENLETSEKTMLVYAINEVLGEVHALSQSFDQKVGDATTLETENKDNLVDAINEVLGVAQEKELFIADYNNTTLAEILSARDSGKVCVCSYNDYLLLLNGITNSEATFTAWYGIGTYLKCSVSADNHWSVEKKNYYKTPTITANNTDDQIPTAAAVYKALQSVGAEPEIFVGYEDETTYDELLRQIGYGKLVFVQENKVTKRLYQYYGQDGSTTRSFYRVDGDGIHWLAVDRENVWSSGTTEITGGSQEPDVVTVQLTANPTSGYTADKTYAQMLEAYKAGKMIVLMQGRLLHVPMSYGPNGMVFYPLPTAYNAPNSNKKYTVTSEDVWSYENANLPVPYTKTVNASSTDSYVPTAKAVYDAIEAKFAAFTNVSEVGA